MSLKKAGKVPAKEFKEINWLLTEIAKLLFTKVSKQAQLIKIIFFEDPSNLIEWSYDL